MTFTPFRRKRLGIFPRSGFQSESRLLASLAQLFPVDFLPEGETGFDRIDAAIFFSEEGAQAEPAFDRGVSSFVFRRSPNTIGLHANANVAFSGHTILHPAFRNARIPVGSATHIAELSAADGDSTLASHESQRLWTFRSNGSTELHTVATELPCLPSGRLLWQYLRPDGWLALIPLLHFLRRVTADADWSPPPQRGSFIFDDPNLHSVGYGYLNYAELAAHARAHNYHVAIATIPLDAWYAGRKAVELFHKHSQRLSLLIHGNGHLKNELARDYSEGEALRMLAQAVRRVGDLERRTGLSVARVIAPPHGGCSGLVLGQASRLPIEGVCTSVEPLARCHDQAILPLDFGLSPAWLTRGGCPVIRRWDLVYGLMPLRLAAFLGQPIIPYGHHRDCAEGLEPLAEIAHAVDSWEQTIWTDVGSILRGLYRTIRDGELIHVQMHSRQVDIPVPEGISDIVVHAPIGSEAEGWELYASSNDAKVQASAPGVSFHAPQSAVLRLRISSHGAVDPATVGPPSYRLWPPVRRALSIGRDRLMPALHVAGGMPTSSAVPHNPNETL